VFITSERRNQNIRGKKIREAGEAVPIWQTTSCCWAVVYASTAAHILYLLWSWMLCSVISECLHKASSCVCASAFLRLCLAGNQKESLMSYALNKVWHIPFVNCQTLYWCLYCLCCHAYWVWWTKRPCCLYPVGTGCYRMRGVDRVFPQKNPASPSSTQTQHCGMVVAFVGSQ
jgi:hypothetical protein